MHAFPLPPLPSPKPFPSVVGADQPPHLFVNGEACAHSTVFPGPWTEFKVRNLFIVDSGENLHICAWLVHNISFTKMV